MHGCGIGGWIFHTSSSTTSNISATCLWENTRQVEIEIHNINSMDSEKMELWHDLYTQVVPDSRGLWNHGVNLNTFGSRVQIIFSGLLHLQLINQKTMSNPQNSGANEKPRSHHHGPIRYLSCRDKGAP